MTTATKPKKWKRVKIGYTPGPWTLSRRLTGINNLFFITAGFCEVNERIVTTISLTENRHETEEVWGGGKRRSTYEVPIPTAETDARIMALAPETIEFVQDALASGTLPDKLDKAARELVERAAGIAALKEE